MPGAGDKDLRKNRSALNNIILTSTGAAKALEFILPEIKTIGSEWTKGLLGVLG